MSAEAIASVATVLACALACLGAARLESRSVALGLAGLAFVVAGVTVAHLAVGVVGVARPDPAAALAFLVLAACGGGWMFTEVNRIARSHSGAAAITLLVASCGAGAATFAFG